MIGSQQVRLYISGECDAARIEKEKDLPEGDGGADKRLWCPLGVV